MTLPKFTLVYRPGQAAYERTKPARLLTAELDEQVKGLASSLRSVEPSIRGALLATARLSSDRAASAEKVAAAVGELRRQAKVVKVGFWDLSSQVGELPRVIEALNAAQPVFAFFEVQAAVPSGLMSRPERVIAWAERGLQRKLRPAQRGQIRNNVIFGDFAGRARQVRRDLGLDYLIGIVPAMIAFDYAGDLYWNFFSRATAGTVLASTFDVYQLAARAGRPFEAAVAGIAVSTLLVALNPRLQFHDEVRGCLFDYNERRYTIVKSFRAARIEPSCVKLIRPVYRVASIAMATALRELAPLRDGAAVPSSSARVVIERGSAAKPHRGRHQMASKKARKSAAKGKAAGKAKRPAKAKAVAKRKATLKKAKKAAAKRPRVAAKK